MKKILLASVAALGALAFWRRHEVKSAAERGAKAAKPAAAAMKDRISGSSAASDEDAAGNGDAAENMTDQVPSEETAATEESERSTSD